MKLSDCSAREQHELAMLEARVGSALVHQRLAREREPTSPHDRWYSKYRLIRAGLTLAGLRARGRRNCLDIQLRHNQFVLAELPGSFDGYGLLHLTDLHLDVHPGFADHLGARLRDVRHDLCVLTGDFRFRSFGAIQPTLNALARLRPYLGEHVVAVLGNHDSIRMVAGMEALGITVLMNESLPVRRGDETLALAGIDDAHYFRTHDIDRAMVGLAPDACCILLSHTPEPYRLAEQAGASVMLCGHTHGGQICLPGGIPILTDSAAPRAFARGAWRYRGMAGYTSVGCGSSIVDVRLNCLPEVTLHRLRRG